MVEPAIPSSLPLFPLQVVLVPGAALDLRIFERRYLEELIDQHQSGQRDYSAPLWTLLMFDAFLRNVVDQPAAATSVLAA